ncbi:ABC transporter permease [Streptomyces sp. NBC_00536]|uniref:ABC transporter permease n=1 Tax=Streptomyces sp. NBC_00536 TaxID=2975769 RepID=UPI002E81CB4B|nr:ABC transporter permease [Streptomyces sp. NBC_00536]WUC78791.1 ABC transporter permease [Streptomyces sp. NBC_00536]
MTTLAHSVSDSATMLRRNLRHALRYPSMTISVAVMPVMMLLLFNYVFGGALGTGTGSEHYIDYIAPGIILMSATAGAVATAVGVCVDMTEGIVNRFRTMPISRASFLTGHVVGGVIQTLISVALVTGISLLMGFRPSAGAVEWLAVGGLLTGLVLALTWLAAAMGLVAKTPETASNMPMPLTFLPLLGSAIVPTDSMPTGLRWFAEYQPFTPLIETLRGLLMGTPIGHNGILAAGWCAGLALVGYLWARSVFNRDTTR